MSAQLKIDEMPIIQWKGKTFSQISSSIQYNRRTNPTVNKVSLFKALPLKIYRREIVTNLNYCNSRNSVTIDELNRPNGSINNTSSVPLNKYWQNSILDNTLPNNTSDYTNKRTNCNNESAALLSAEVNARKRVRSSGIIKRQFDISKNNDSYYTSTSQYLVARNRTFQQNQYNYIRQGDSTATPGTALSYGNVYSPNGINHCQKYQMSATTFSYIWIDGTTNIVSYPGGYYSVEDINAIFKQKMVDNYHYLILTPTNNTVFVGAQLQRLDNYIGIQNIGFLMNIGYNNDASKVELQLMEIDTNTFNASKATPPAGQNWTSVFNATPKTPQFKIDDSKFGNAIGFSLATYPASVQTTNQTFVSSFVPGIKPLYVKLYYKPNNPKFGQQGGVSSSSLILRKKYDSITNSSSLYRRAYGASVANALAYGVSEAGYTIKDKMGYPNKKTPVFPKYLNAMKMCSLKKITNEI